MHTWHRPNKVDILSIDSDPALALVPTLPSPTGPSPTSDSWASWIGEGMAEEFNDENLYRIKGALVLFVLVSFSGYVC